VSCVVVWQSVICMVLVGVVVWQHINFIFCLFFGGVQRVRRTFCELCVGLAACHNYGTCIM